jgi:hypothetical protein
MAFKRTFDEDVIESFDIYFFIETINSFSLKHCKSRFYWPHKFNEETKRAWAFFELNSAHIELIFQGNLEKYYFPIQPANRFISEQDKNSFLDGCNRNSPSEKLLDFLSQVNMLLDQMDHMVKLRTGDYGIAVSPKWLSFFRLTH